MTPTRTNTLLFGPGDASDPYYTNVRAAENDLTLAAREFAENLWAKYYSYADQNFLVEARRDFNARFWEMYLTCSLLEWAASDRYRIRCPKPGPDILLELAGERVWIEAVTATNGDPSQPDSLIEPDPNASYTIPEEKIVLRYTNAIREKYQKYLRYLRKGIVSETDAYVVAINDSALAYKWTKADGDVPRFLKAVYPIGSFQLLLCKKTGTVVGNQNEPRFDLIKANGAQVTARAFIERRWRGISAVICSSAHVGWRGPLGSDFQVAHNPCGRRPLSQGALPWAREWSAKLEGAECELFCQEKV